MNNFVAEQPFSILLILKKKLKLKKMHFIFVLFYGKKCILL
jgi:hypothetical protein